MARSALDKKPTLILENNMKRCSFQHNDLTLSYLDAGGDGQVLIALHAHWMEGKTFLHLANTFYPAWRVIALDQRGHGDSDHAANYRRDDYLCDLEALFQHLHITKPAILLGNSLGGINAYYFAARHPDLIRAMIIEDIGVEIEVDVNFSLAWEGTFKTQEELAERIGPRLTPYLQDSFRQTEKGWQLAFNPREMVTSSNLAAGDHWTAWLASDCPTLLIRGKESRVITQVHLEEMALRRPNTIFRVLDGGHVVHADNPIEFTETVSKFLLAL